MIDSLIVIWAHHHHPHRTSLVFSHRTRVPISLAGIRCRFVRLHILLGVIAVAWYIAAAETLLLTNRWCSDHAWKNNTSRKDTWNRSIEANPVTTWYCWQIAIYINVPVESPKTWTANLHVQIPKPTFYETPFEQLNRWSFLSRL